MPEVEVNLESDKRVESVGPDDAKIALIGEAPGKTEVKKGKPFVGSSGRLLDQLLRSANIRRNRCYITNVVKKRPKGNDFSTFYVDGSKKHPKVPKDFLKQARTNLIQELKEVDPNVIVCLGAEPLKALKGEEDLRIGKWRGSILRSPAGKMVPTYHPAYIMRMFKHNPIMSFDLQRARRESRTSEIDLPDRNLRTEPTFNEAKNFLEKCKQSEYVSFDIETFKIGGKDESEQWWYIDSVGFAYDSKNAMCIPLSHPNGNTYWSIDDEMEILRLMADVLSDWDIKKIAQNAKYDVIFMERLGVPVNNIYLDTMVAANEMHAEFPRSLAFLSSIYTREPYYKDTSSSERWVYNAKDAAVTYEIGEKFLEEELEEYGIKDFYRDHVHPLIPIFNEVEQRGVRVDDERMKEIGDPLEHKIEKLRAKLKDLTGREINVYSTVDMRGYIYDHLGMKKKYNDNNNLDTSKEVLNDFYRNTGREEFQVMIELRKARSASSTYLNASRSPDGRIRTSYKISSVKSGRLSSTKNIFGRGMNLQNVEKDYRTIFIPEEGYKFLSADLGQAENRVVAYVSEDKKMIDVVESEGDIHRNNAAMIFNKPLEEITTEERQLGKRITHGVNYQMGPRTLAKYAQVPTRVAKKHLKKYHDTYPKVRMWHKEIEKKVRQTRELVNPFGRKRTFYGRMNSSTFREATSFVPQCLPLDCEVLTENGWKTLRSIYARDYDSKEPIAVWDSGEICFESPTKWHGGFAKDFIELEELGYYCTTNHRIPYYNAGRSSLQTRYAENLPKGARVPRTGKYSGEEKVDSNFVKWLVAIQADAHYDMEADWIQFNLYKSRKINRLRRIMNNLDIEYADNPIKNSDGRTFYISKNQSKVGSWAKYFDSWLLDLSGKNLDTFLKELQYWDGWKDENDVIWYSSSEKQNCEWVSTIGALRGYRVRWLSTDTRYDRPNYRITIAPNKGQRTNPNKKRVEKERQPVACPEVSSGYFLVRASGEISITGNSTVADCMHRATEEIYANLPANCWVALQLHDEITIQCPNEKVEECAEIMREALTRPFTIDGKEISIPTDVCVGSNWKQVSDEDYAERVL